MLRRRNLREFLTDASLTLALYCLCAPNGQIGDRLKAMKLLFLACYDMFRRREKGFNFSFYRYEYGPFTPEVYETWEDLTTSRMLEIEPEPWGGVRLTDEGRQLAEEFLNGVLADARNLSFNQSLRAVADTYGGENTDALLRKVYAKRIRPLGWEEETTIGAVPTGVYLTRIIESSEARAALALDDSWLQTLDLVRQRARAAAAGIPFVHTRESLQQVHEAIEAEARGEGVQTTIESLKQMYGLG